LVDLGNDHHTVFREIDRELNNLGFGGTAGEIMNGLWAKHQLECVQMGSSDDEARRASIGRALNQCVVVFTRLGVWKGSLAGAIDESVRRRFLEQGNYLYQALYILAETDNVAKHKHRADGGQGMTYVDRNGRNNTYYTVGRGSGAAGGRGRLR